MATPMDGVKATSRALPRRQGLRGEQGIILPVTLLVVLLLTALGSALLTLSSAEIVQGRLSQNRLQAFNLAEAGEAYARRALSLGTTNPATENLDGVGGVDQTQVFDDNVPVTWNSSGVLDSLQKGATGTVTIARHTGDTKLAVITSEAKFGWATKKVEVIVRRPNPVPPFARGPLTSRSPVVMSGSIKLDGRDHTINGNLIPGNGAAGIFTQGTFTQNDSSKIGGTAGSVDFVPANPGNPAVIMQNQTPGSFPSTPDAVMGDPINYPPGTLWAQSRSGVCGPGSLPGTEYCYDPATGNQFAQNPADLLMPMQGVTYVELPAPPNNIWDNANLGNSTGIVVVSNPTGNARLQNTTSSGSSCGCFRGLLITDELVNLNSKITGAVVTLSATVNTTGSGSEVLFSRAALPPVGALVVKIWPRYSWREVN